MICDSQAPRLRRGEMTVGVDVASLQRRWYLALMLAAETTAYILRDDRGVAWIGTTNIKVIEVVLDHIAYGWSAEAIHEQQPHLSLAQIHAVLAFYYDHQGEFEAQIEQQLQELRDLKAATGESALQHRLRALARAV